MSLPVRECGLRSFEKLTSIAIKTVTPCAGVWIEMSEQIIESYDEAVTPCAGVWIEIIRPYQRKLSSLVTPCAGVWIEICELYIYMYGR